MLYYCSEDQDFGHTAVKSCRQSGSNQNLVTLLELFLMISREAVLEIYPYQTGLNDCRNFISNLTKIKTLNFTSLKCVYKFLISQETSSIIAN